MKSLFTFSTDNEQGESSCFLYALFACSIFYSANSSAIYRLAKMRNALRETQRNKQEVKQVLEFL